ncbi:XK-related 6-like [Paramuricea clavata]|uniref:XK-related protein n=1 Tax=Paramuricea clavata TaxID=317549 RepID=A0A6S7FR68_PARCT|nr:XK-related 6-like [Paramuricea clavata]
MCQICNRMKSWCTDRGIYRRWVNMRGKKELFMLITGLVLFIFDLVTDIFVGVRYRLKGEYWWFGLTLLFIIVPLYIVGVMAAYQTVSKDNLISSLSFACTWWPIFARYVDEFKYWKQTYRDDHPCGDNYKECSCADCEQYRVAITTSNKSAYRLAWVRYVETLTESTPQWCLQVYIMLRQWDFPWLTVLSAVVSLLSLAWSITALEKARVNKNSHNFTLPATVVFFTSQLSSLLSRLFAISAVAYVFKEHVITALVVHWKMMSVVTWLRITNFDDGMCDEVKRFFQNSILSFLLMLHVPNAFTKEYSSSRILHIVLYNLISVENVLLAIFAVTIPTPDVKHMSVLRPIVLSLVIIGVVQGTIFYIIYDKLFTPGQEPHEPDEEENV